MAFYHQYPPQQLQFQLQPPPQPQQAFFNYSHLDEHRDGVDRVPPPDPYGSANADVNARDVSQAPRMDEVQWQASYQNVAQPVPQHVDSSLAHALDDLHVSYSQQLQDAPDPNTFYEYREVLRHRNSEYEEQGGAASTFPVADDVPCLEAAQVPCAEYGESYCSDDDSPYGALASPLLPYDAASPYTDVVDSPVTDFADAYADTIHSPIHFNSQGFDIPVVPSRSYTLEKAVTPMPSSILDAPRSPSLAETKRSASTSTSLSETTGSSPGTSASPMPSSKASTPLSITSTSSSGSGKPRGRPRKRQALDCKSSTSPPRIVDYPYPKFDASSSGIPTPPLPTPDTKRIAPRPDLPVSQPQVVSMDEIPIPDAESKPGQAIFKLNTPPEVKEKPKKKPILACLFCRERKIACGQPLPGSTKCNQCARRGLDCEFPKESRRGQHKRGPRAARVAALTEAALSAAKRPLEPAPFPSSSSNDGEDALASGSGSRQRVKAEPSQCGL